MDIARKARTGSGVGWGRGGREERVFAVLATKGYRTTL